MLRMLGNFKTLIALTLMAVGVIVGTAWVSGVDDDRVHFVGQTGVQASVPEWVLDERYLVGAADNVFVGRVVEVKDRVSSSTTSVPPPAQSQFAVEVLKNVKGDLAGAVTVNQGGGYQEYSADRDYPEAGIQQGDRVRELDLVNDDPLLEPGQEYLFVTGYDRKNDWHEVVAPHLGDIKLKDQMQRRALVEKFEKAKREQVDPYTNTVPLRSS